MKRRIGHDTRMAGVTGGWRRGISEAITLNNSNRPLNSSGLKRRRFCSGWYEEIQFQRSSGIVPCSTVGGAWPTLHGVDAATLCPLSPYRTGSLGARKWGLCARTMCTLGVLWTQKRYGVIVQSPLILMVLVRKWFNGWEPPEEWASRTTYQASGTCVRAQWGQERPLVMLLIALEKSCYVLQVALGPAVLLMQLPLFWDYRMTLNWHSSCCSLVIVEIIGLPHMPSMFNDYLWTCLSCVLDPYASRVSSLRRWCLWIYQRFLLCLYRVGRI